MNSSNSRGNRIRVLIGLAVGLIILCVAVSFLTVNVLAPQGEWARHDQADGHEWLRQQLDLTPTEMEAINAIEPDYRRDRAELQTKFQAKIEELRQEIVSSEEFSGETNRIIHELHIIHGQLQELSIRHYYQMMQALPPEKQARLRDIAARALSIPQ